MMQHTLQGRRALLRGMAAILACGTAPAAVRAAAPLKIGLLTPFSGPLARVAEANRNCLMMAVDEINAAGGLLGQALQIVSEDSQMSAKVSLDKARKLLAGDGVAMVTGMVLPFEREAVLQVASRYRRLVVYPNFDEGRCHPLLLTTGLASNQRVVPLIDWAVAQAGKSFFVLASDIGSNRSTLLPQIEAAIQARGGRLLGTRFFPFGTRDYGPALQQIQGLGADVVWHSIGDDPVSFVKQYRSFGMKPQLITDIAHESLAMSTEGALAGTVGVSSYFMGVENPENQRFLDTYTRRFSDATPLRVGGHVVMLPHGESTYAGAKLFAAAAGRAGSIEADAVKKALPGVSLRMPRGAVGVDAGASHLQCQTMIGRARKDGGFDLLGAAPSIQAQCGAA